MENRIIMKYSDVRSIVYSYMRCITDYHIFSEAEYCKAHDKYRDAYYRDLIYRGTDGK